MRFYCRVLCLSHACCLPQGAKQDGLRCVAFLFRRGSGSPFVRSQMSRDYRAYLVHFGIVRFVWRFRRVTKGRGNGRTKPAVQRGCSLAQLYWPCRVFHGEYAGAEMWKPHCGLSGLSSCDSRSCAFHVGRACALYAGVERFRSIGDLTGSDLWPVKSCITARQQAEPAQPAAASGSRTAATRVHGKPRPALIYGRTGRAVYRCYLFALSET